MLSNGADFNFVAKVTRLDKDIAVKLKKELENYIINNPAGASLRVW